MNILMILLGGILFLDCIFLVFLVLIQLPKKDAGAGMAFGGGATDALFGAGSGNALTTLTKYSAGTFFLVTVLMAWISAHGNRPGTDTLSDQITQSRGGISAPLIPTETSNAPGLTPSASSNAPATGTNAPAPSSLQPTATPAPAAKPATNNK